MNAPSRLLPAICLLSLLSGAASAAETVFPAGSRIGLVPSERMVQARGMAGFVDPGTGATIVMIEMPAAAYGQVAAGFSEDALKAQGFTQKSRDEVRVGDGAGLLLSGDQAESGRAVPKTVLLTSDAQMTALVIGQLPVGASAESEAHLRSVLRTVSIRAPLSMDAQIAALPFTLADRAGFRAIRVLAGNSLLLTDGPREEIRAAEQPILIVAQSFAAAPPPEQRDAFARSALVANTLLKDAVLERAQGFRQNGAEWHEIVARATDAPSGEKVIVMQTIRFDPGSYLRVVGIVRAQDREAVIARFRQVADGVAPK